MKNIYLLISLSLISFYSVAQCNPYFDVKEGMHKETITYDKKDRVDSKQTMDVEKVTNTPGGYKYDLHLITHNKKGKETLNKVVPSECVNGVMKTDMKLFLPSDLKESEDMTITSEILEWPSELNESTVLHNASLKISTSVLSVIIEIKDRKVVGTETVTVPAGTFDCIKVESTSRAKILFNKETKLVEYIAKGVGVVKSETYKKDKLDSYTVLSKVSGL